MTDLQPDLAAALVAFQASAPTINKGRTALIPTKSGGSYSYKYADLSDIWEAIREPLKANGLAVTQSLTGGSQGFLGITTTVWHTTGQTTAGTVELAINTKTPQEVGSQITYFKRYALSALLGLSTEEDDDGAAASRRHEPTPAAPTPMQQALEELGDLCAGLRLSASDVAAQFYAKNKVMPRGSTPETVREFMKTLSNKPAAQEAAS